MRSRSNPTFSSFVIRFSFLIFISIKRHNSFFFLVCYSLFGIPLQKTDQPMFIVYLNESKTISLSFAERVAFSNDTLDYNVR